MKKTQYIEPAMQVTRIYQLDGILQAVSGPGLSYKDADPKVEMDTKASRNDYNVWSDDWSR